MLGPFPRMAEADLMMVCRYIRIGRHTPVCVPYRTLRVLELLEDYPHREDNNLPQEGYTMFEDNTVFR